MGGCQGPSYPCRRLWGGSPHSREGLGGAPQDKAGRQPPRGGGLLKCLSKCLSKALLKGLLKGLAKCCFKGPLKPKGSRSGCLAKCFCWRPGCQGQKTTHVKEKSGLLALPPKAARPKTCPSNVWFLALVPQALKKRLDRKNTSGSL